MSDVIFDPDVQLISWTEYKPPVGGRGEVLAAEVGTPGCESVIEFAGRACYQSFGRPNPATAATSDYIANIMRQGHTSVLEHSSAGFYITGISRNCSHEIVRHRMLSFSQMSQRYVDESGANFVMPPALEETIGVGIAAGAASSAGRDYESLVKILMDSGAAEGMTRKTAREAARAVLAGGTETRMVVTGNFRAWIHFINMRDSDAADAEIARLAGEIREQLAAHAPAVFGPDAEQIWRLQ